MFSLMFYLILYHINISTLSVLTHFIYNKCIFILNIYSQLMGSWGRRPSSLLAPNSPELTIINYRRQSLKGIIDIL